LCFEQGDPVVVKELRSEEDLGGRRGGRRRNGYKTGGEGERASRSFIF
jgi:hypothetical protein